MRGYQLKLRRKALWGTRMQLSIVRPVAAFRDLWRAAVVAVCVAFMFTVAASVFEQFHQVAAEDLNVHEVTAERSGIRSQMLFVTAWGVRLHMPIGQDQSLLTYAAEGPDSVGLSSTALDEFGTACTASRNAAGALERLAIGQTVEKGQVLGTFDGFEYVYVQPTSPCMNVDGAANFAAQEAIAITGAGSLSQ